MLHILFKLLPNNTAWTFWGSLGMLINNYKLTCVILCEMNLLFTVDIVSIGRESSDFR